MEDQAVVDAVAGAVTDKPKANESSSGRALAPGDVSYRVGVDVGGTFTDLVCVSSTGDLLLDKTPTTPEDQSVGVMTGLGQLAVTLRLSLEDFCHRIEAFMHGTTVADNAMIEMSGAPTGMLVTEGHRDEIELRRVHKEEIWDPTFPPPPPLARRRARIPIPERVDFEGNVVLALDEQAVSQGVRRLRKLGVRSIAVEFLFSFVNPDHELRAREIILEEYPEVEHVSLSHEVLPRAPEFERASTTLVNAYVAPTIAVYTENLATRLTKAGFAGEMMIMQATGGVMPPGYVSRRAVTLLGSGPTGGVMGAAVAARRSKVEDFVAIDMGGTSYDVCLVRGAKPEVSIDWNWRYRYYIGLPMIDVRAVGAGGGSIARVRQGALLVGPESAGAQPGPACYGWGGTSATVTDADCVLGYLPIEDFAGGRMPLDPGAAREAIARDVGGPLSLGVEDAAWAIERIVNTNMANAVRKTLASYGVDPRELAMIAYGGNGPVHAWAQARELGIRRVLVPKSSPQFSALGLLVADFLVDLVRAYVVPLGQVDLGHVHRIMRDLTDEATSELAPTGLGPEELRLQLFAEMCYPGQNFDMSVPVPEATTLSDEGLLDLASRFHRQHERERGFSFPNQQVLLRGVRLVAEGATPKPPNLAPTGDVVEASVAKKGERSMRLGDDEFSAPVYQGLLLGPGAVVEGPALVEEPFMVVVLPPGDVAKVDDHGNYDIAIGG